jgi:tetratricopeptide (TPR) repeat protein
MLSIERVDGNLYRLVQNRAEHRANAEILFKEGVLAEQEGRAEAAIEKYEKAVQCDLSFAEPCINIGNIWLSRGDTDKALWYYRRAVSIEPTNATAQYNFGVVLETMHLYKEAVARYRTALALDQKFANAHFYLARALCQMQQYRQALRHYRSFLKHCDSRDGGITVAQQQIAKLQDYDLRLVWEKPAE